MKSLQQVIHAVQYELDCSISELSRKLGKSRNYLSTTMKKGLSQEKEQELIEKLLNLVDDENAMLRNVIKEKNDLLEIKQSVIAHQDSELEKYTAMCDTQRLFIDGQDEEIKGLKERVNVLVDKNNAQQESIRALCSDIKHSEELVEIGSNQIDRQQKTINSLKEVSRELGLDSQSLSRKNRILTGALIGMGLLWAVSVWVMS